MARSFETCFSWGKNGNERIGGFRYTSLMDGGQNYTLEVDILSTRAILQKVGETTGSMQYGSSPASNSNPKDEMGRIRTN